MNHFSTISIQTLWQVLGKVVTSLSTFIILGIVTRNYGKEGTGVFTLVLTYLAIFYLLADFGFNAHVLRKFKDRFSSENLQEQTNSNVKPEWQKLLGTRILWSGILVILAVGLLPFWPFSTPIFSQAVIFGSLAIVGSAVFITCNLTFQSKLRYDLSVLASSLGTIIGLIVTVWLVIIRRPISHLIFGHLVSWIVIALISLILSSRAISVAIFHRKGSIFDLNYTINLFKDSWPIAATLALNVVYFRADSFMIAYFKGAADVGIYNVAYAVFQSALVLPAFIMNSYYPLMLKSFAAVKYVGFSLLGLSFLGTFVTIFLAPFFIKTLTGTGFSGSVVSLQILALGFPAYFLSSLLMWILITRGRYKQMLLLYTSALIFNLMINFIYIPKYSFLAASWITVISEYLILILQLMVLLFGKNQTVDDKG